MSRSKFEEWWLSGICLNDTERATYEYGIAFDAWLAGRKSMRDEAEAACNAVNSEFSEHPEMALTCTDVIRKIEP